MRFIVYTPGDSTRVLKRVVLAKSTALPRDHTNHYRLALGVQSGPRMTVLGEYLGNVNRLEDGGRFTLFEGEWALGETDLVALEASTAGSPGGLHNASLIVTTATRAKPGSRIDPVLASYLFSAGLLERETVFPLVGVDTALRGAAFEAKTSYTINDKTITAGAGATLTDVAITFTKPPWATRGYVNVTGMGTPAALGAAGSGTVSIYDGAQNVDTLQFSTSTTFRVIAPVGYAGEIVNTTTFTLSFSAATNDLVLEESLIYGTCSWR